MNRQRGFAIGPIVYGVIALALVSVIGYGVHTYNEQVRAKAVIETQEEMKKDFTEELNEKLGCSSVDLCQAYLNTLTDKIKLQNDASRRWKADETKRFADAAAAEAVNKAEIAKLAGEYQKLMEQQPTVKGDSCASACMLLRSQPLL